MKKYFLLLSFSSVFSCSQNVKKEECDVLKENEFSGRAIIFFHKPVSGSTYQLFLFPLCDVEKTEPSNKEYIWDNLGTGISFNLSSDNPQFQLLRENTDVINLSGREHMDESRRTIYWCQAKVETSYSGIKMDSKVESKELVFESDNVTLKYHFLSFVSLKIVSFIR